MKIKKQELQTALEAVKPGLSNNEKLIEQATSFAFINKHVVTYNDQIAVRYPISINITGAVRADELYKLVSKLKDEEIEISVDEADNMLHLECGRSKAGIRLESEIKLPLDELGNSKDWVKLPETFLPALKMIQPFAADDMSKPVLSNIYINGRYLTASDDFRIMRVDIGNGGKKAFKEAVLLPATAVKSLTRYPIAEFCETAGWAHFRAGNGLIFSCRTDAGEFPDVSEFLNVEGVELKLPSLTKEILERAGIFSKAESIRDEQVIVSVKNRRIIFKGEGDYGWFEENANCAYKGDDIQFIVSPTFLYDILDKLQHCIVGKNSLKFQGENFEHVVCLIGE